MAGVSGRADSASCCGIGPGIASTETEVRSIAAGRLRRHVATSRPQLQFGVAAPRLLTAGEAFEDLVFVGLERLPAPGEEVKTDSFHATIGGGAVITAVAAARLGLATAILSALSAPAVARLRRERVRVHNLRQPREPHAITAALSTITDRAFVTFNGVNAVLEPRLLDALASTSAGHVHLALTPLDLAAWTRCVKRLRRGGATVSWDFGWSESLALRPELPALMDALDLVFVNELEAPLYAQVNALDDAYPPLRARKCGVVVKLGSLGSRWLRSGSDGRRGDAGSAGHGRRHDRRRRRLQRRVPVGLAARQHPGDVPGHREHGGCGVDPRGRRDRRAAPRLVPAGAAPPQGRGPRPSSRPAAPAQADHAEARPGPAVAEDLVKLAIIGGAGVRVPLLAGGFARSTLHVDRIDLYDIDQPRLAVIADLASRMAHGVPVHAHVSPDACIDGADFVITSIRAGGAAQRAADEATTIALGVVGQETVGPAGFAMAIRTIPPMVEYGRLAARLAPQAWFVNFSNPVSVVSQAVHQHSDARIIGICDTPTETFEDAAHALGLPPAACEYDYFGLNHLGWLREVTFQGEPQIARLWDDDARLAAAYRSPLFEPERLRADAAAAHRIPLLLLPARRWRWRICSARAAAAARPWRRSRRSSSPIWPRACADPVVRYQQYLAARDASYMQLETGTTTPRVKPDWAELSGYDRIALMTISAIAGNTGAVIPLDLPNRGTLPFLDDEDIIEVPCVVDAKGPHARPVAKVPAHARALITCVKEYERATVKAAMSGRRDDRIDALAMNPLVHSRPLAESLVDALLPA